MGRRKYYRRRKGSKISKMKSSILRSLMKSSRRGSRYRRRRGRKGRRSGFNLSNIKGNSIFGVNSGIRKSRKGGASGLKAFDNALKSSLLY